MEDAVRILRCLAVINLPNTIEKRPIVEYLQTKKLLKFEAIELLTSLVSLEKFYRFFLFILFVAYIQKFFL